MPLSILGLCLLAVSASTSPTADEDSLIQSQVHVGRPIPPTGELRRDGQDRDVSKPALNDADASAEKADQASCASDNRLQQTVLAEVVGFEAAFRNAGDPPDWCSKSATVNMEFNLEMFKAAKMPGLNDCPGDQWNKLVFDKQLKDKDSLKLLIKHIGTEFAEDVKDPSCELFNKIDLGKDNCISFCELFLAQQVFLPAAAQPQWVKDLKEGSKVKKAGIIKSADPQTQAYRRSKMNQIVFPKESQACFDCQASFHYCLAMKIDHGSAGGDNGIDCGLTYNDLGNFKTDEVHPPSSHPVCWAKKDDFRLPSARDRVGHMVNDPYSWWTHFRLGKAHTCDNLKDISRVDIVCSCDPYTDIFMAMPCKHPWFPECQTLEEYDLDHPEEHKYFLQHFPKMDTMVASVKGYQNRAREIVTTHRGRDLGTELKAYELVLRKECFDATKEKELADEWRNKTAAAAKIAPSDKTDYGPHHLADVKAAQYWAALSDMMLYCRLEQDMHDVTESIRQKIPNKVDIKGTPTDATDPTIHQPTNAEEIKWGHVVQPKAKDAAKTKEAFDKKYVDTDGKMHRTLKDSKPLEPPRTDLRRAEQGKTAALGARPRDVMREAMEKEMKKASLLETSRACDDHDNMPDCEEAGCTWNTDNEDPGNEHCA